MPARAIARSTSMSSVAGPIVQIIFVFLISTPHNQKWKYNTGPHRWQSRLWRKWFIQIIFQNVSKALQFRFILSAFPSIKTRFNLFCNFNTPIFYSQLFFPTIRTPFPLKYHTFLTKSVVLSMFTKENLQNIYSFCSMTLQIM